MRLTRLEIQQLPGIEPGFVLDDLADGVNLVTGPNAIGKSSLIRALRYLVGEPDGSDPLALSLSAELVADSGRWTVRRTGQQVSWTCDGRPADRPPLPDRSALHYYWLTMEDLAVAGDSDQALVDQLLQALTGGFDLQGLRQSLFPLSARAGHHERRALESTRRTLREVEADYVRLQQEEQELPELDRHIGEAREARSQSARLDAALLLTDVLSEKRQVQSEIERFPSGMDRLRGNELEQLDRLERQCRELEQEQQRAEQSLETAREQSLRTAPAGEPPDPGELEGMRALLEQAVRRQDQWQGLRDEQLQVAQEEELALAALSAKNSELALTPEKLDQASRFASRLEQNRQASERIRTGLDSAEEPPGEEQLRTHWRGVDALSAWLSAREAAVTLRRGRPGLLLALVGALAAALLAAWRQHWWAAAAAAAGLAGAVWSLFRQSGNPGESARLEYAKTGLDEPIGWSESGVRERLHALRDEAGELERRRDRFLAVQGERARLRELESEAQSLADEQERLAADVGFDPALAGQGIQRFLDLVSRHDRARVRHSALTEQMSERERAIAERRKSVQAFLLGQRIECGASLPELEAALQALTVRCREHEEARQAHATAERDLRRIRKALAERGQETEALYREAGIAPGDRQVLEDRIGQLEAYRALRSRLQVLDGREVEPRRLLADHPDLQSLAARGERDTLLRQRDGAGESGERYDALIERRSDVRARLGEAGSDHRLETALHEVEQSRAALLDRCAEQMAAETGRFLLDDIEREHQSEHEPEVLREARDLFGRFTHHAWDVRVDETGLQAVDRQRDEPRRLAELSSGTRMQLLLAVRLAWTRRLEQGRESLPLFLDEALTTSDESRFAAVAASLEALAGDERRQVFYLAARRHELMLWERMTGKPPHPVDLAAVRFGRPQVAAEDYSLPASRQLPPPGTDTDDVYAARLQVPAIDPWQSAGEMPVFHLLRDDLPLLHRLMEDWRVTTMGQLQGLLDSSSAAAALPEEAMRRVLTGRCHTARLWQQIWLEGRNSPVDSTALQRSGAVTDTFLEPVTALAARVDGDPEALLAALRDRQVARFRKDAVDALEEWLQGEGYITPGEPLDPEARLRRVLMRAGERTGPDEIRRVVGWLEAGHTIEPPAML